MSKAVRSVCVAVVAIAVSAGLAGTGPATAQTTSFAPGSRNGGDPYFPLLGNGGYDVQHYNIDFSYDPGTARMAGSTSLTALATKNLSRFNLDFSGLVVRSVKVNGANAAFRRQGQELMVTPPSGLPRGQTFTADVVYDGNPTQIVDPDGSIEGWIVTDDGAYVVGEPQGTMTWFPGNHDPRDKATHTFRVTVPDGTTAVANGALTSTTASGGQTTFVWTSDEPMADFAATATIGRFDLTQTPTATGMNYIFVDPSTGTASTNPVYQTPDILTWLSTKYGPYPFYASGGVVDNAGFVGYALEAQTKPLYPFAPFTQLVVHELSHQWYGVSVTPTSWRDVWLNEGFATYTEWLWNEQASGRSVQEQFDSAYARPASDSFWQVPPGDPGPQNLFHPTVYSRGAMTLQALRNTVGSRVFFYIMRDWADSNRYGNVTTQKFVDLAEQWSGRQLDDLFQRWLYTPGKPSFP